MLLKLKDRRVQHGIADVIDRLKHEPEKQGKPLVGELLGYRSVRAVGQRYRVIYTLEDAVVAVLVVVIGIRREGSKDDVYSLAKKLLRRGLLTASTDDDAFSEVVPGDDL
ncbi:MAG: type II toxin-antitoxin system RelE/ParE family toxin [Chloroflexota bacterium]|nr:type II toxin-antitoxin system RelE/ParE family toxin [Chloroflexota bacterium]